jgi:hypothetical protein
MEDKMAVGIRNESYKIPEFQSEQVKSAKADVSEEKMTSAQETSVNPEANEKHSKGAREVATSKKADAQLQAMSLQMQLNASETTSSALSELANNNVQQLAQPSSDEGPVDSKAYAQQNYSDSLTKIQNSSESLREEIADRREASENSTNADDTRGNTPKQGEEPSAESESELFKFDLQNAYQAYQQANDLMSNMIKQTQKEKETIIKNAKA